MAEPLVSITGSREAPECVKLTTTNVTTIVSGPTSGTITTESIRYSCGNSGSDLSLWFSDGTTDFPLMNGVVIAANTTDTVDDNIVLKVGASIKAQASTANEITIIIVPILSGKGLTANLQGI